MITKKQLLKSFKEMPESISVEEIIDRVLLLQKIEIGLEQSASGQVHSTEKAKRKLKKWVK